MTSSGTLRDSPPIARVWNVRAHARSYGQRLRRIFLGCLAAVLLTAMFAAPSAAQFTVSITPPPLNQLKVADLWRLQVINGGRSPFSVYFAGTITEERDGLVADGTSAIVTVRPGVNMFVGSRVEPVDIGYGAPKYERALTRTGGAPSGVYQICVQAIEAESGRILGEDCITHEVSLLSPPILISPAEGDVVHTALPTFLFTPASGGRIARVRSQIRIAELYRRQSSFQAIASNPPVFQGFVTGTAFQYPASARKFQEGTYVWQVTAIDPETGSQLAQSEVGIFRWEPYQLVLVPVELQKVPGIPNSITNELLAPCSGEMGIPVEKDVIETSDSPRRLQIRNLSPVG